MRRVRSRDIRFQNYFCSACGFAVELAICIFVWPERRAIERYAGKNTSRAGVALNLRTHISVCIGCRRQFRFIGREAGDELLRLQARYARACPVLHNHERNCSFCQLASRMEGRNPENRPDALSDNDMYT